MIYKNLLKDTVIYGGGDLLTKIINFIFFPIVATYISASAFGHLEIISTIITLFSLIVNLGLNNSLQRFYWDSESTEDMRKKMVTAGLVVQLGIGILFSSLTYFLIKDGISYFGVERLPFWTTVSAASLVCLNQISQYILDVTRLQFAPYKYLTLTFFTRVFATFFSLYFIIQLGMGVSGYLISQAIVLALIFPVSVYLVKKDLHYSFDKKQAKVLVKFGYPFLFSGLAYYLFGSMDRWMLARMSSLEEVGVYSVGFRFASIVVFIAGAFGQAWSPYAIKVKTDHPDKYREFYAHILSVLFFIMLVIGGGLALFSGEIIGLLMPESYRESSSSMIFLIFGVILQTTTQVTGIGISLEKKTRLFSRIAWITALINFVFNWFLIPRYGAMGASCSTAISYLALTSGYIYYTQKIHALLMDWKLLGTEFLLGGLVLIGSLFLSSHTFEVKLVLTKLVIALICLIVVIPMLPIKQIKSFS